MLWIVPSALSRPRQRRELTSHLRTRPYGSDATNEAMFGSDTTDATTEPMANYKDAKEKLCGIVSPPTADEATADITNKDKVYALKLHNYLTELKKVCVEIGNDLSIRPTSA